MLIAGIALGLLLGLLLGGRIERLADLRLKFLPLLFTGVIVRFGTELFIQLGVGWADTLRVPLFGLAYGLLLFTLWQNRGYPGLALAFVGVASNALVIMVNAGYMPVWLPAYTAAGLTLPMGTVLHTPLPLELGPEFLLRLGPLADIIPIPIPPLNNVASVGDLFLTGGLSFFLFSTVLRIPEETRSAIDEAKTGRYTGVAGTAGLQAPSTPGGPLAPAPDIAIPSAPPPSPGAGAAVLDAAAAPSIAPTSTWSYFPPGEAVSPDAIRIGTGLSPGLEEAAALERPLFLGGGGVGMASPALTPIAADELADARTVALSQATSTAVGTSTAIPALRPTPLEGARQH